jgi:lysylphosphatidylglycerol synthetase-like protein (DUF2156 family)
MNIAHCAGGIFVVCLIWMHRTLCSWKFFRKEASMRKMPFAGVFLFFALAVPFTIVALAGVAYVDLHFSRIALSLTEFSQSVTAGGRGLIAESAQRLPEALGMLIGLIVMLTIFAFSRQANSIENNHK